MARHLHTMTATILSGQTTVELKGEEAKRAFSQATGVTIFPPGILPEAVEVWVAPDDDPVAGDYVDTGLAITQGKSLPIPTTILMAMKLVAGGAVGADRTFKIQVQIEAGLFYEVGNN